MKQTSKSLVTTLGFLVVAGAIAGAAFWVQKDVTKEETKKEKAAKVFDGLDLMHYPLGQRSEPLL